MNPDTVLNAENWTEAVPHLGGYPVRPYMMLVEDFYYTPPGFYDREDAFLFQPGWGGVDGNDPVLFRFEDRPTLGEVRERIASLLASSYLVQERDDAPRFGLGDEPGSIVAPWGTIPADVIFAPHPLEDEDRDEPWENLDAVLTDIDRVFEACAAASAAGAYVDWRLRAVVPANTGTRFHADSTGALHVVLYPDGVSRPDDNVHFTWGADGSPLGGEREEYEVGGFVGLYEAIPVPPSEDALTKAVVIYA